MIAAPLIVLVAAACAGSSPTQSAPIALAPRERTAVVTTTGCGFAADRAGSGVAIGGDLVVTVAHLVVQAEEVMVAVGADKAKPAEVLAVDLTRDIAVLRSPGLDLVEVEMREAAVGVTGGVATPALDPAPFRVTEVANISIEEVLGTERHERRGYAIDAATGPGDSGSGAYDDAAGFIGMVFAFSEDPLLTWVTSSGEIADFLSGVDPEAQALVCDDTLSRLRLTGD